jgi:hypothetical protein
VLSASRDLDQHAVGISELELALVALGDEFEPDIAFGSAGFDGSAGFLLPNSDGPFEWLEIFNSETRMLQVPRFDDSVIIIPDQRSLVQSRCAPPVVFRVVIDVPESVTVYSYVLSSSISSVSNRPSNRHLPRSPASNAEARSMTPAQLPALSWSINDATLLLVRTQCRFRKSIMWSSPRPEE